MVNETTNPINHGVVGALGHTAGGAAIGGVKSGIKTLGYTILAGAAIGAIWMSGGFGLLPAAASGVLSNVLIGAGIGGVVSLPFAGLFSAFGTAFGAAKGGAQAYDRVRDEKGAANMVKAQLQGMQMQAMAERSAPTTVYAPTAVNDNKYGSASTMNLADSNSIQAASAQLDGRAAGAQLQRA